MKECKYCNHCRMYVTHDAQGFDDEILYLCKKRNYGKAEKPCENYKDRSGDMNIDNDIKKIIEQEIEKLKRVNAEMRVQMEQEINRNSIHIYALEKLIKDS